MIVIDCRQVHAQKTQQFCSPDCSLLTRFIFQILNLHGSVYCAILRLIAQDDKNSLDHFAHCEDTQIPMITFSKKSQVLIICAGFFLRKSLGR